MKRNSHGMASIYVIASILAILLAAGQAQAEDIYYAQAPAGSGGGESCANARAISDLAWGPGTGRIGAGDTAHLCGTITTAITVGASGSDANNPVTVKFEDNARMSKDTWGDGGSAITISGNSWVVIDGGTNGIIESTDVGSAKTYRHYNTGVSISGTSSDIEVRNLTIPQLYSRTRSNSGDFAGSGIKLNQGTLSDIRIHHNTISKAEVLIYVVYRAYSNIRIYNNTLTHGAAGIIVGDPTSNSTIDTVELYNNTVNLYDDAADLNCTNTYHNDGIHFWAVASGSSYRNVKVYGNTIGPDMGACTATTGWIFLEDTRSNILIYNNLLLANDSNQCPTDAMIYDKGDGSASNNGAQIYNNTFAYVGGSRKGCTGVEVQEGGGIVKNNIFMNLNYAVFGGPIASPFTNDYNLYYNNSNNVEGQSNEPHGIYKNPSLDASYRYISIISPGVNAGTDLSALFTTDKDGNPRAGRWDVGAYEYVDTTPPTVTSGDPAAGSINVGISSKLNVTFSELMDTATINNATFVVTGGGGGVSGTISTTDAALSTVATFAPAVALQYGTTYTATITTGVKDLSSNSMAQSYIWTFTTANAPDNAPPTVSSTNPPGGATGISTGAPITVTFSEAMDASSIVPAAFILTGGGSTIPCTASYGGAQATFLPSSSLARSTTYTGTVTSLVKDLAGNRMAVDYTWTFTTEGDSITPPPSGGGGGGGGGGGCSVARGEKSNGQSPMGTILVLIVPAILLFLRRAIRRIHRIKNVKF